MTVLSSPPVLAPESTVLLVLLPLAPRPADLPAALGQLQHQLGPQVQVLRIDEATHPAVVRSFGTTELPACVLLRDGVELWRHQGLPNDATSLGSLLRTLHPA
ncbi:thioredoxin [Hymenobacter sp. NST-14]|uniref:thioredoxin n=1 Tax=Hymenobacter piscis TaxID=2839984 RepID=UPI001C033FF6|nr:thioredoxin [Hymenobacter piscis]MBT9394998.1 thioredoxin [Hymenobacter piscis]